MKPFTAIDFLHLLLIAYGSVFFVIHFTNVVLLVIEQIGAFYIWLVRDTAQREIAKRGAQS